MGTPDAHGIAQCSYCGTKIMLPPSDAGKERKNLDRYRELCRAEKQAKNWEKVLKYADGILEINPRDDDAWLDKALAAGSLSNYLIPRLDEALGYLNNAGELSPDDARVTATRDLVIDVQFNSYVGQALYLNREAEKIRNMGSALRDHAGQYAAEAMVMSAERAEQLGLTPLARFVSFAVGGVPPEFMGIGPIVAIPKALKLAGLTLNDIDLIELNEAFAAQSLAVIRTLEMDENKVNVNGGAIALGHPLGCTGSKLTTQLIYEMGRRKSKYGMVTMCIGGGMGAAAIFENLQN